MDTGVEHGGVGRPLDPSAIRTTAELAEALTALRHRAGISIRKLSSLTGIPSATLGGYFSGRHLPSVSQGSAYADMLQALGVTDRAELGAWFDAVRRLRSRPVHPAAGSSPATVPNPYRGLRSFTEEDADRFFGREAYVDEVLDQVQAQRRPGGHGVVAVVAPSGAGKSSLLRGGVVPALRRLDPPAAVVVLEPGTEPVAALEEHVPRPSDGRAGAGRPDVVVVDQFEELFASGITPEVRRGFLEGLAALTGEGAAVVVGLRADFYGPALREPELLPALQDAQVVLGPMAEADLRRAIAEPARSVGVTVDDELVEVLLRDLAPRGLGGTFPKEHGAHQAGALPLLSHALMTAWERRSGPGLTVGDYLATGGITGAVQATAEAAYTSLDARQQDLARRLFSRLVNVDEEGVLTRRRARHEELEHLAGPGGGQDDDSLSDVLERFIGARLLTATDTTVEVTHEALLDAWPRLWEWIEADRDALRVRRRVAAAATLWAEQGRDESGLLRGAPLAAAAELLEDERGLLAPAEREFVELSRVREGAALRAEQRRSRRLGQLLVAMTVLAVVAGALAVYALDSRSEARHQRAAANRARDAALSRQVAIEADRLMATDPIRARLLAVAGHRISPTLKARSTLLDAAALPDATRFVGPDGSMHASATPDGSLLAFAGADGSVRLWQRADGGGYELAGEAVGDEEGGLLFASAVSPDGRLLAVGGITGTVTLLDVTDPSAPEQVAVLDDPESAVQGLAFAPDGTTLAAATSDPAVHRWRLTSGEPELLEAVDGFEDSVQAVAYSPRGDLLATASNDGLMRLWHLDGDRVRPAAEVAVGDRDNDVHTVAFSPDGRTVAAGAKDKVVRLWDVSDPGSPRQLDSPATRQDSFVNSVAFSADGSMLAAASSDGSARVWDAATGAELRRIPVPANVTTVAFTDDDGALLTGSLDGTGRLWSLEARQVRGLEDNIWSLGYDESGTRMVVGAGTGDGAVHVYDVAPSGASRHASALRAPDVAGVLDGAAAISADGTLVAGGTSTGHVVLWQEQGDGFREVAVLEPSTQLIEVVTFSRDGRLLGSIGDDGAAVLWDVATLVDGGDREAAEVARVDVGTIPLGMALNHDGSLLAVGAADNQVHLWALEESGAVAERLDPLGGFTNYAIGTAFSTDGDLLAVGSSDSSVRIWDVSDPSAIEQVGPPLTGASDTVYSVAWHPDGDRLAGAATDGTVWLWEMAPGGDVRPAASLLGLAGDAYVVAFSPDGELLGAGGSGGTVQVWDTGLQAAEDRICASAGTRLSRAEWRRYLPGAPYDPPCG